jgi:hypothetical protein
MAALIFLPLNLGASLFKFKNQLEAENAALRQMTLQRKMRGRGYSESPVLHPAVSLVSVSPQGHHDHPAQDPTEDGLHIRGPLLITNRPLDHVTVESALA